MVTSKSLDLVSVEKCKMSKKFIIYLPTRFVNRVSTNCKSVVRLVELSLYKRYRTKKTSIVEKEKKREKEKKKTSFKS